MRKLSFDLGGSMGVHDHRAAAASIGTLLVRIVVVSSSRTAETDESGPVLQKLFETAGHAVTSRSVIPDDVAAIQAEVKKAVADGQTRLLFLTGGPGLSARDVTPQAIEPLFARPLPGFGELFRWLSFQDVGPAAMLSRATAGVVGGVLVVAVPGSPAACRLALERLLLPELAHLVHELFKESPATPARMPVRTPAPAPNARIAAIEEPEPTAETDIRPKLPEPSGTLGRLGKGRVQVQAAEQPAPTPAAAVEAEIGPTGWQRAIYEIRGQLETGTWPVIPEEIEKVAPVVDVIHRAPERGTLKLPSGRTYAVFGFPDLRSAGSKVLALGDGSPFGEVLALHRYPVQTGTCVEGSVALLPHRGASVASVCEAVTGKTPKDTSGRVFAIQGDAVWIERGTKAIRWDGLREREEGTLKQALASLVLDWSRR